MRHQLKKQNGNESNFLTKLLKRFQSLPLFIAFFLPVFLLWPAKPATQLPKPWQLPYPLSPWFFALKSRRTHVDIDAILSKIWLPEDLTLMALVRPGPSYQQEPAASTLHDLVFICLSLIELPLKRKKNTGAAFCFYLFYFTDSSSIPLCIVILHFTPCMHERGS